MFFINLSWPELICHFGQWDIPAAVHKIHYEACNQKSSLGSSWCLKFISFEIFRFENIYNRPNMQVISEVTPIYLIIQVSKNVSRYMLSQVLM